MKQLWRELPKALRLTHWSKNLLVFVPLVAAHKLTEPGLILYGLYAFAAFSLGASGIYVINDLWDREEDRRHPVKRERPFAAGRLTARQGGGVALVLLAGSVTMALLLLPAAFLLVLGLYLGSAVLYSLFLKRIVLVDLLVLTGFYLLRIYAGGVSTETPVSRWLLAFSLFFFLSLACMKRFADLLMIQQHPATPRPHRGYHVEDLALLRRVGTASGYLSILILALYVNSEAVTVLYARPAVLWATLPVLLYWLTRTWRQAHRGQMTDDPIVLAIKDPVNYIAGAAVAAVVLAAAL